MMKAVESAFEYLRRTPSVDDSAIEMIATKRKNDTVTMESLVQLRGSNMTELKDSTKELMR